MKRLPILIVSVSLVIAMFGGSAFAQYLWTKSPSPVFTGSATESWNKEVWAPSILFNTDSSRYEMWFSTGPGPEANWRPFQIGCAVSQDGISWNRVGSRPVLTAIPGTWQANVFNPTVLREAGSYKMWYSASSLGLEDSAFIGYATSPDGITWSRYAGNPVLRAGSAAWEANSLSEPFVVHAGGLYQMWYDGGPSDANVSRIGRATSLDGISWTKDSVHNPVLDMGGVGQWDAGAVTFPRVFSTKDTLFMCYTCIQSNGLVRRIGLARSADGGIVWQKWGQGPILSSGGSGSWDQGFVQDGLVLVVGDTLLMFYSGSNPSTNRVAIGRAISPTLGVADRESRLPERFTLAQNYPNPFNPSTVISYQLPVASDVRLVVYDLIGREVAVLENERRAPGSYEVKFDAAGLASGVYLYRLASGQFVQTRKMLVIK